MHWLAMRSSDLQGGIAPAAAQAEVLMVMPATDINAAERCARLMVDRSDVVDAAVLVVVDDAALGFVAVANSVFRAAQGAYFGYVAQDAFAGRQWLRQAMHTLKTSRKGLLAFNDGKWGGVLAAFGLGHRPWLAHNYGGDLFYPKYRQHYADTELSVLALGNRQMAFNPLALLVEIDWEKDRKSVFAVDKALFAERRAGCLRNCVQWPQSLEMFQ